MNTTDNGYVNHETMTVAMEGHIPSVRNTQASTYIKTLPRRDTARPLYTLAIAEYVINAYR